MARKKQNNITEVMFNYVGTYDQFTEFLKSLVHDYLTAEGSGGVMNGEIVHSVESESA